MSENQISPNAACTDKKNMSVRPHRIAIVGAGCCGLRIATLLKKHTVQNSVNLQLEVVLLERQPHAGGFLRSGRHSDGLIVESGAQGVLSSRQIFLETLEDLGMTPDDVIVPDPRGGGQSRYILTNAGVLAKLSPNLFSLWRSGLITLGMIFRVLFEFFLFLGPGRPTPIPGETLYQFFQRHFGRRCAENFIVPIATGIWGGASERLLLKYSFPALINIERRSGSLLRHALINAVGAFFKAKPSSNLKNEWPRGLLSFPGGMQTLIERMQKFVLESNNISFKTNYTVESVKRLPDNRLLINDTEEFDTVFWTSSPWQTVGLSFDEIAAQKQWTHLHQTPTHNLIVVHVSGHASAATRKGFGLLASRHSDGLLGVLFVHTIYKAHTPKESYSYRVLLGGDRNPEMIDWSDAQLQSYAISKLSELGLILNKDDFETVYVIKWRDAIGIADEAHEDRLSALWRIEAIYPQLRFAGIYKKGVGVADALSSAQEAVDNWLSELRPSR